MIRRLFLFGLIFIAASSSYAQPQLQPAEKRNWSFQTIAGAPIQSGGRVKPFDSFARDLILFITGKSHFEKWNSLDLMFSWMTAPQDWLDRPFIQVSHPDVRKQLLFDVNRTHFSPRELASNSVLGQYMENMDRLAVADEDKVRKPRENEMKQTVSRLMAYRGVVDGTLLTFIPVELPHPWKDISPRNPENQNHPIVSSFKALVQTYYSKEEARFQESSQEFISQIRSEMKAKGIEHDTISEELLYNTTRPFLWSWIFYLLGSILVTMALFTSASTSKRIKTAGFGAIVLGLLFSVFGFALRMIVSGRPPVSNMYESIVWVSFGAMIFAWLIYWRQRNLMMVAVGAMVSALTLIVADAAPAVMDPSIQTLVAVLRSNLWLTIHVLTITLGYSAFLLSFGLGNVALFQYQRQARGLKKDRQGISLSRKIEELNQLSYRAMQFGVVLLAAGTILGGVWADYSWGRFWGWDPKEVWALIALLTYLAVLHGRFAGWVGSFGFAAWGVLGFLSVVMAWYGVNFVLGVGLHSYGFTSGGGSSVGIFVLIQMVFVGWVTFLHQRAK